MEQDLGSARWAIAIALSVLVPTCALGSALADPSEIHDPLAILAQSAPPAEPHLPDAPDPVGEVHRDKDGKIVVTDPTALHGTGQRICSSGVVCVGPSQAYRTLASALAAARQGDVIEVVAGTYHETVKITHRNISIRGINGRPHFDCAGLRIAEDKGCFLLAADAVTLENIEISGAEISQSSGANGACIRNEPDVSFTLRRIVCHGSQDGILSEGGTIVIENSEFYDNGWTDRTHNVYLGGNCVSVTVRGSIFRDVRIGHEFKSRCRTTSISDSTFHSTHGSRDIDLPDGGEAMIFRSTLTKTAGAQSQEIIGFAAESCRYSGSLTLKQVHIVNATAIADIRNFDTCPGKPIALQAVTFEGAPVRLLGYVREE